MRADTHTHTMTTSQDDAVHFFQVHQRKQRGFQCCPPYFPTCHAIVSPGLAHIYAPKIRQSPTSVLEKKIASLDLKQFQQDCFVSAP